MNLLKVQRAIRRLSVFYNATPVNKARRKSINIPPASQQHPTSIPLASHQHPISIPTASYQHPNSIPPSSHQHPTNIPLASHQHPTICTESEIPSSSVVTQIVNTSIDHIDHIAQSYSIHYFYTCLYCICL